MFPGGWQDIYLKRLHIIRYHILLRFLSQNIQYKYCLINNHIYKTKGQAIEVT
jgi:hypothetical protein